MSAKARRDEQEGPAVSDSSAVSMRQPAELRLLLACIRSNPGPNEQQLLSELLSCSLRWDYFLSMAGWHGVLPLVAKRLAARPEVPESVLESLRAFALRTAQWNLHLAAELIRISTEFDSRGIPHISYKGTLLSEYLYGNISSRDIGDIDLIVMREAVSKAIPCLEALGFQDSHRLNAAQRETAIRYGFEHSFTRNELTVDLHWRIVQKFAWPSLNENMIWRHLVPYSFQEHELRIFSPELMLVSLCIHAAQHDWNQLKMFVDVAALLVKCPHLDWRSIEPWVSDSHSKRSTLVALLLAHRHLGAALPSGAGEEIARSPECERIAEFVSSKFWPSPKDPTFQQVDLRWLLYRTHGEHPIDRWRYILHTALNPTLADFKSMNIPRHFRWIYLLLRPLRIALKRMRSLRILFRRDPVK